MTKQRATTGRNHDFQQAKQAKRDEFYTSLKDIEVELKHYTKHFKDKVVYCNCDDPRASNFFRYFSYNFEKLGLKKLITTCYRSQDVELFGEGDSDQAVYLEYSGDKIQNNVPSAEEIGIKPLTGDGDFRSIESIELLEQADIVVTNPPFSLFSEYVSQLVEHNKKFVIIGNMNAVTYTNVFGLIQNNQMWYGPSIRSGDREFRVPNGYPITAAGSRIDDHGNKYIRVKGVRWFTNLEYPGRHEDLKLQKTYCPVANPKYANFDAIEVGKTQNIPWDYDGPMGVPITFLDKFNPDQFEILGSSKTLSHPMSQIAQKGTYQPGGPRFYLPNGDGTYRRMYERIVIKKKQP
ncbi:adenine-specific methyltransferase EcoRI family protein [Pseudidiomarina sp. 1APP75-27a]|uniref:adenine-specific methyltransferase EcoRI family protein n=1 Tax=Pseudidiomarina terrestris TaxID=2820060 RepID=UPI002B05B6B4|nr:adenine-specific methyltransferase EcoRI family protein [Pseudidiomarina sp. 1APP75-27a]MEA3588413.1 adenine-specific methyltransferase EcoRI family protein [Pseudidiomarina sp. 1APP75-27a]